MIYILPQNCLRYQLKSYPIEELSKKLSIEELPKLKKQQHDAITYQQLFPKDLEIIVVGDRITLLWHPQSLQLQVDMIYCSYYPHRLIPKHRNLSNSLSIMSIWAEPFVLLSDVTRKLMITPSCRRFMRAVQHKKTRLLIMRQEC